MIDWHHLFGWTLTDYFRNSNYRVDLEKDVSKKPQRLDVIIIEESLALLELFGHYVNYRKLIDPDNWEDLPLEAFRLYAVSTRYPQKINRELKKNSQVLKQIKQGVYETFYGNQPVRVIVLNQIPPTTKNAVWQLFSGNAEGFQFGQENYQWRYPPAIATLKSLFQLYQTEGVNMEPSYEAFLQECVRETLEIFPLEERLKGIPPKEVLEQFSVEDRLRGLPVEERLRGLPPEVLEKQLAKLRQKSP